MTTFKVNKTDLPWPDICESFSEPSGKYLAVQHVNSKRKHVHVYIDEPVEELPKRIKQYNREFKEGRQGPFKLSNKTIDPQFLNYMVKEKQWEDNIKANRGYTGLQLAEAHEESEEYRKQLKEELYNYLEENMPVYDTPDGLHRHLKLLAVEYYLETGKCYPPNLQKMILSYMVRLAPTKDVKLYVSNFI